MPSIVFEVKDSSGNDVTGVRVTMDGRSLTARLEGTAIPVDPGEHRFIFEANGFPTTEKTLVIHEGEKERHERVVGAPGTPVETPTSGTSPHDNVVPSAPEPNGSGIPSTEPAASSSPGTRPLAYAALGVGGAGVIVAAVFGVLALGNKSSLDGACGPSKSACPTSSQSDIDGLHRNSIISDVGLAVGVVGLGVGGALLLFGGSGGGSDRTAPSARVDVWLSASGAGLRGAF